MSECILTFNANKSLKKNHQNQRHYTFNNVIQTEKSIILANKFIRPDWYYLELKWRASSVKILHFLFFQSVDEIEPILVEMVHEQAFKMFYGIFRFFLENSNCWSFALSYSIRFGKQTYRYVIVGVVHP